MIMVLSSEAHDSRESRVPTNRRRIHRMALNHFHVSFMEQESGHLRFATSKRNPLIVLPWILFRLYRSH